jgi:hypothetical protein
MQNILALQSLEVATTDALDAEVFISTMSILCCGIGTDRVVFTFHG